MAAVVNRWEPACMGICSSPQEPRSEGDAGPNHPKASPGDPTIKRKVLGRYERTADGKFIIDISAAKAEDLYNDFDRTAPYVRRDLDQDLVAYLIDCAREMGSRGFILSFTLAQSPQAEALSRIRQSVRGFFSYLAEIERRKVRRMFRTSAVLFSVGVVILFVAVGAKRLISLVWPLVGGVFAEGLTVAAWVALWQALATFLIEWFPARKEIMIFEKLANAEVVFRSGAEHR